MHDLKKPILSVNFHFLGAPVKFDFLKNGLNIIDILAVLPFYVSLFFIHQENTELGYKWSWDKRYFIIFML